MANEAFITLGEDLWDPEWFGPRWAYLLTATQLADGLAKFTLLAPGVLTVTQLLSFTTRHGTPNGPLASWPTVATAVSAANRVKAQVSFYIPGLVALRAGTTLDQIQTAIWPGGAPNGR